MALTKKTVVDKIETCMKPDAGFYFLQIRERRQILEDGKEISSNYHRYVIYPSHDVTKITDATVLAQFNAVMTDDVKSKHKKYQLEREAEREAEKD